MDEPNKIPQKIFIGGDIKYGLGEMIWENKFYETNIDDEWISKDDFIVNYLPVNNVNQKQSDGKIELLVEIDKPWEQAELKVTLRDNGFFYTPGTKIADINASTIEKGILKNS